MTEVSVSKSELKKLVKIKKLVETIYLIKKSPIQEWQLEKIMRTEKKLVKTILKYNYKHTIAEPF